MCLVAVIFPRIYFLPLATVRLGAFFDSIARPRPYCLAPRVNFFGLPFFGIFLGLPDSIFKLLQFLWISLIQAPTIAEEGNDLALHRIHFENLGLPAFHAFTTSI